MVFAFFWHLSSNNKVKFTLILTLVRQLLIKNYRRRHEINNHCTLWEYIFFIYRMSGKIDGLLKITRVVLYKANYSYITWNIFIQFYYVKGKKNKKYWMWNKYKVSILMIIIKFYSLWVVGMNIKIVGDIGMGMHGYGILHRPTILLSL